LLRNESDPAQRDALKAELSAVERGAARQRLAALRDQPVVGVTLASASCAALDDNQFVIVFLDESSQQFEAQSLLAVTRFQTRCLMLSGDPMQLPPPLHNCFGSVSSASPSSLGGLGRTLFDRLAALTDGCGVVMLQTQYRCHPTLSALANRLFYGGVLLDGAPACAVQACVALPTLVFINVDGSAACEQRARGGSFVNHVEAQIVLHALRLLARATVEASDIGVICWYKAQMAHLHEQLEANKLQEQLDIEAKCREQLDQLDELDDNDDDDDMNDTDEATTDNVADDHNCDTGNVHVGTVDGGLIVFI